MTIIFTPSQQRALYYSPLSFLRGHEQLLATSFLDGLNKAVNNGVVERIGLDVKIWVRYLEWDSVYFSCPTYRLEFVDWDPDVIEPATNVAEKLIELKAELLDRHGRYYLFMEIPSEDVVALQALGLSGFRLIETRLTHYIDDLESFEEPSAFPVRVARKEDAENLRDVAMRARNDFDRFHADPFFSDLVADEYLAEYTAQCILGLTDIVLVPNVDRLLPNAFVCGTLNINAPNEMHIGRLVLVAVADERRGWYRHLNSALLIWMKNNGMSYCVNTTQSTNRAVIHVCEQLGYKYGRSAHLLATHQKQESN
jgi:dTDP-4-amino-4,6-dideoxy-D-galactose acyltransferase